MELADLLGRIFLLSICATHLALIILWWTDTKVTPHDPPLLVLMPLCDPFSLGISRICDLLLMNGIWKGDGMSLPRLGYVICLEEWVVTSVTHS